MTIAEAIERYQNIVYPSGWKWAWITNPGESHWLLLTPGRLAAASVYGPSATGGYNWFVWDRDERGGENSFEPTIEQAMITAESAVLRWGKHK